MPARQRLVRVMLAVILGLLAVNAILSLRWRFQHDPPILLYIAWLIDRLGYAPYRDIFDINLPGTYAFYYLIGKVSGYTNLGVRCVDLSILAAELVLTWLWMKKLGATIALCGSILWGLCYLQLGSQVSIQREYLIILPLLAGIVLADRFRENNYSWKACGVGLCFGVVAMMKPHAAIGFPLVLFLQQKDRRMGPFLSRVVLPAAVGFCLPIIAAFSYLWWKDALTSFLDMGLNYWPLYLHLSGDHQTLHGMARLDYLWSEFRWLGGFGLWLVPSTVGAYCSMYRSSFSVDQKRQIMLLVTLAICYGLYPLLSGQFWIYHWLLFLYFTVQLAALCLVDLNPESSKEEKLVPVIVLALYILLQVQVPEGMVAAIQGRGVAPVKDGRVDAIAAFLHSQMRPGDTVQPLDWTGGAVHAMLMSEARLATPFVYDFHFYHDISNGYIQELRRRFISALRQSRPRFIVQIVGLDKPWVRGEDTTIEFEELKSLIANNYDAVSAGAGYVIYRSRNDSYRK
jgi:hypothetical protein